MESILTEENPKTVYPVRPARAGVAEKPWKIEFPASSQSADAEVAFIVTGNFDIDSKRRYDAERDARTRAEWKFEEAHGFLDREQMQVLVTNAHNSVWVYVNVG